MGRRGHHRHRDYDSEYVDHGMGKCSEHAGGMDRYHDYEYYAQERAYSNQSGDIYDKSQEYETRSRQKKSAAKANYEQYIHLKKLGIADDIYQWPYGKKFSKSQKTADKYKDKTYATENSIDEEALQKEERRRLMLEAQAAMKAQETSEKKSNDSFFRKLLLTLGMFVSSLGMIFVGFLAFAIAVFSVFWILKTIAEATIG